MGGKGQITTLFTFAYIALFNRRKDLFEPRGQSKGGNAVESFARRLSLWTSRYRAPQEFEVSGD
jgi:hypothetical protein